MLFGPANFISDENANNIIGIMLRRAPNITQHPMGKFFEFLLFQHFSPATKYRNKINYPQYKKGALAFCKKNTDQLLIDPIKTLFQDLLARKIRPPCIDLKYSKIDRGVFEIMYNPIVRERVEILTLLNHPVNEIQNFVNQIPLIQPVELRSLRQYIYFFWNVNHSRVTDQPYFPVFRDYIQSNPQFRQFYANHIKLTSGNYSPLEVAVELGLDVGSDLVLNELKRGFSLGVIRKNQSLKKYAYDDADILSKINLRDAAIMKSMGKKTESVRLSDKFEIKENNKNAEGGE